MSSTEAARTVSARIDALPPAFRRAALAWVRPAADLATALAPATGADAALQGVPYLLKDLFDLAGVPTQAGSTFLNAVRGTPMRDGALPRQLHALGAACAGKTHLVEFAAGLFGDNSHYGDCPHPYDPTRLAGGSSSGSAALVAAGVVPFAIGTDTGGSVRVPAAFCGLYGFRLSPGDDFIRDAMALAPSLDTAGWFTAHASDMLVACAALIGRANPPDEPFTRSRGSPRVSSKASAEEDGFAPPARPPRGCFLPASAFDLTFDPATAAAYDWAAARYAAPADAVTSTELFAAWRGAIAAYTVTALHEANAIHRAWLTPYRDHYEPSIWQRFSDGAQFTADQRASAAATFERVRTVFRKYFAQHDYLILPATPFPALRKSEGTPEARKALLTLTTPASLAGLPVLTIPVALPSGLTSGLQIILPHANSSTVPWLLKR